MNCIHCCFSASDTGEGAWEYDVAEEVGDPTKDEETN